ncbi:hypothetical protein BgAZ_108570 [Babesia gibsoni]|uniref:Uncharacterized protein n=1 Tax=Babesia gibsoni TaxID=33632 RepID=A0AAD8PGH1_BABGI|nr:hypothetical protein BgAZ_108570 [Babesia gibsoni]
MNTHPILLFILARLCFAKHKHKGSPVKSLKIAPCGEGQKGLLNYQFDRDDEEALITTAGYLSKNVLKLYTGSVNYQTIYLNNSISPVETLGEKCFAIRNRNSLPSILCASGLLERNKWVNAIDASMLCAETGVKSMLPLIPGEETLEELDEDKPSGINLFVHDGPMGRPEIYINGKTTKQLEEERNKESLDASQLPLELEPVDGMDHLFPTLESKGNEPLNTISIDEDAMAEARAEAGIHDSSSPDMGYYKQEHKA